MNCNICEDEGLEDYGGYRVPCRGCEKGNIVKISDLKKSIKAREKLLKQDRKLLKALEGGME
jgi:hypothetical protein